MVRVVDSSVGSVFRCDVMVRVVDPSVMSMFRCDVMVRVVDPSVRSVSVSYTHLTLPTKIGV